MATTAEDIRRELSGRVRLLAEPVRAGETVQILIHRVARRAGLAHGQIKRICYQEWIVVPAHVADTLREIDLQHQQRQAKTQAMAEEIFRLLHGPSDD